MATRTRAEAGTVMGLRFDGLGLLALAGDTVLNAGGMWAFVLKLDSTESYKMFAQSLQLGADMRLLPALILALVFGAALSLAPQKLWNDPEAQGFMSRRRAAAIVAQFGGWWTTWLFLTTLAGSTVIVFALSVGLEWLLFEFKRGLFPKGG